MACKGEGDSFREQELFDWSPIDPGELIVPQVGHQMLFNYVPELVKNALEYDGHRFVVDQVIHQMDTTTGGPHVIIWVYVKPYVTPKKNHSDSMGGPYPFGTK
jgi:hypothetical protein